MLSEISVQIQSFPEQWFFRKQVVGLTKSISSHCIFILCISVEFTQQSFDFCEALAFLILIFFFFILDESNLEDSSDDNRSSSLGRSAPSDDMSVASDYQEEGATEREFKPLYEHMSVFTRMSNACKL